MKDSIVTLLILIVQLLFVAGFLGIIYLLFIYPQKRYDQAFTALAAKYGLQYQKSGAVTYNGIILGKVERAMVGNDPQTGKRLDIFHYTHETGSGKSRRVYRRTVAAVGIRPTGVHLFINSELNDFGETPDLDRSQRYEAEGNFGKYFDMYFPGGKQIEALSIFAPDVLALIIGKFGDFDIEIVDDVLYLYKYAQDQKIEAVESFVVLARELAAEVDSNSPRKLRFTGTPDARQRIGLPLQRLQSARLGAATAVIMGVVFVVYVINILNFGSDSVSNIVMPLVVIGVFITTFWRTQSIVRKKKDYQKERQLYLSQRTKQ